MTAKLIGVGRLVVVTVIVIQLSVAPTAAAVTPPPVDPALLPEPGPPVPSQATERHEECVTEMAGSRTDARSPTQFDGLALTAVWPLSRGSGQTVAVIDTGVARHRLLPRLTPGGDYVAHGDGHGTLVAGIIAAATEPGSGSAFGGVAPESAVIAIRQSSNKFRPVDRPSRSGVGDVETLAKAVRTAADLGATVINVSSVACLAATDPLDDRALGAALAYAVDVKNVVVVAAAGNTGSPGQCPEQNPADPNAPGRPDWDTVRAVVSPAWYDDLVLTVGSVGADGAPSPFTLAGPWVDVAAPGEHVVSLDPDGDGLVDALPGPGGPQPISGTSYATPVVSAVAALVRARWPRLTARQVMQRIEDTAHRPASGWDPRVGSGVVDALAAVSGAPSGPRTLGGPPSTIAGTPGAPDSDPQPRRIAYYGVAACAAVTVIVALSGRRGRTSVTGRR